MSLITVKEAAERAKVSVKAIYYALSEGLLTEHKMYGKLLVDENELENYRPRGGGGRPSRRRSQAQ